MSDQERDNYLLSLRSNILFQKHVLSPLDLKRRTLVRDLTSGELSDERLRFTAGALASCEYLASLFEQAVKRNAVKKGQRT